ncbi:MAG: alpha/beta fold hydrolase [Deltaproteobacteria bacterium]|nr:alpha/beta fold hydrolase [Deltaproteobacteria bacterium]
MTALAIIGTVLGGLVGVIVLYVVIVVFGPISPPRIQLMDFSKEATKGVKAGPPESRIDIGFDVDGKTINGRLYLPKDLTKPVPCIVMNNGFGGTMDMGVEPFALRYVDAGMAALSYDYRHFGASQGEPRQLYSAQKQIADCMAAVEYARNRDEIDRSKICIWGTSSGGGYGLVVAARDKEIAAVCGQCPSLDGHADGQMALKREGMWFFLGFLPHASRDKGRSRIGLSSHTVPIVGPVGSRALLNAPGAFEGYSRLVPGSFKNEVCARLALENDHSLNPINHAKDVECPVLLQPCTNDNIVALSAALKTAEILGDKASLIEYPVGHFDIYFGEHFERGVTDQIDFFNKHLFPHLSAQPPV